ncbi:MAG: hypothetical protein ACRDYB_08570 [Acidimicrobiales bacterium]
MTARPHTTAIDTLDAVEAAELMAMLVEMCDADDGPLTEALWWVTDGYRVSWLRQDLVRLARAMRTGIEL